MKLYQIYSYVADKLLYIYTSGTTGLPKAAIVINSRYHTFIQVFGETWFSSFEDLVQFISFRSTVNWTYNKCFTVIYFREFTETVAYAVISYGVLSSYLKWMAVNYTHLALYVARHFNLLADVLVTNWFQYYQHLHDAVVILLCLRNGSVVHWLLLSITESNSVSSITKEFDCH